MLIEVSEERMYLLRDITMTVPRLPLLRLPECEEKEQ